MKTPSPRLRAAMEQRIDEVARDTSTGNWPNRHFFSERLLLVNGNQAYFWYLGLDGSLYSVDHDTVALRLERETDPSRIRAILVEAQERFPDLSELLED